MAHKIVDGVQVELTADEIAAIAANEQAWNDGAYDRKMSDIRQERNRLIAETDYLALSDNTLSDDMKTYRQALRDITEGVTTLDQANAVTFPTKPS
tara:strand:+ start:2165 stop:2452 length:288 start_codon:yes stop_codon:yes gene_type:complete